MSKNETRRENQQEHDVRQPENEASIEKQRERSVRNTEKRYEAESPADPYQNSSEEIIDRAQDNLDIAENDLKENDDLNLAENRAQPEQQSGINRTTDEDILTTNSQDNEGNRDNQENERPDGELRK